MIILSSDSGSEDVTLDDIVDEPPLGGCCGTLLSFLAANDCCLFLISKSSTIERVLFPLRSSLFEWD